MKKNGLKLMLMLIVCLLCSCSKESLNDADEETNVVSWNNTRYDVCYSWCTDPVRPAPSNDKYFGVNLALENSEHPGKSLYLSCVNYIYGEKVDLTTDKYDSSITFNDGRQTYSYEGGSSKIEPGSYYILSRKGDRISVAIHLLYSNGSHDKEKLDVEYEGKLRDSDYLPAEDWQNKASYSYGFTSDGVSYMYGKWAEFDIKDGIAFFSCYAFEKGNREKTETNFDMTVNNFELGKKIDLSDRSYYRWSSFVRYENVLPGSYMYVTLGENGYEITIELLYKNSSGESHHLLIEYNVYK